MPQRVPYNTHNLRFKHFGFNLGLLISKAISCEDADERRAFVSYLVRLMRTFYATWAKENVEDEAIFQSLLELSKGQLRDDITLIRTDGLVEGTPRERTGDQPQRISNQPQQRSGGQTTRSYPNNGGQYGNRDTGQGRPNNRNDNGQNKGNTNQRGPRNGGTGRNDNGSGQGFRPNNRNDGDSSTRPRNDGPRSDGPRNDGPRNDGRGRRR